MSKTTCCFQPCCSTQFFGWIYPKHCLAQWPQSDIALSQLLRAGRTSSGYLAIMGVSYASYAYIRSLLSHRSSLLSFRRILWGFCILHACHAHRKQNHLTKPEDFWGCSCLPFAYLKYKSRPLSLDLHLSLPPHKLDPALTKVCSLSQQANKAFQSSSLDWQEGVWQSVLLDIAQVIVKVDKAMMPSNWM